MRTFFALEPESYMALQIAVPKERSAVRIAVPAGYARIVQLKLNADTKLIEVSVNVYADVDAAARTAPDQPASASPITGGVFVGKLGVGVAGTTLADCYNFLKAQPEFSGSLDV